jgi:hypothetical protein
MTAGSWILCPAKTERSLYNIPNVNPPITVTLVYRIHNAGPAAVNVTPPDTGSVIRIDPGESCDVVGAPWINVVLAGSPLCSTDTSGSTSASGTFELIYSK